MTTEEEKWCGEHLMLISGRWGLRWKEAIRSEGGIRAVTPGKCLSKKGGMREPEGSDSRCSYRAAGAKRVQVKEPSCGG
jgi:hypothetical protein